MSSISSKLLLVYRGLETVRRPHCVSARCLLSSHGQDGYFSMYMCWRGSHRAMQAENPAMYVHATSHRHRIAWVARLNDEAELLV